MNSDNQLNKPVTGLHSKKVMGMLIITSPFLNFELTHILHVYQTFLTFKIFARIEFPNICNILENFEEEIETERTEIILYC